MEIIKAHCTCDNVITPSGQKYNIQRVTKKQNLQTNAWIDIHGSAIKYKPQEISNKLFYLYRTNIIGDSKFKLKCFTRVVINDMVYDERIVTIPIFNQVPIIGYFEFDRQNYSDVWENPNSFKTQIYISNKHENSTNAFLHYTKTVIDRKFAAIFTAPFICLENSDLL